MILVQKTNQRILDRYEDLLAFFRKALPEWDVDILTYMPEELAEISDRRFTQTAFEVGKVLNASKQVTALSRSMVAWKVSFMEQARKLINGR